MQQPGEKQFNKCRALLACGVAKVPSNRRFRGIVANIGPQEVTLCKRKVLISAVPQRTWDDYVIIPDQKPKAPDSAEIMPSSAPVDQVSRAIQLLDDSLEYIDLLGIPRKVQRTVQNMLCKHENR